jgi:transposase InsO family protein
MTNQEEYIVLKEYKRADKTRFLKSKALRARKWKNVKKHAVLLVTEKGIPVARIANSIGVSRTSVYNWLKDYKTHGKTAFNKKSRRPKKIKRTTRYMTKKILDLWEDRKLGCEKIALTLKRVCHMTVYRVLMRFGKIKPGKALRRVWRHYERKHPNSMWQIDLKTISLIPEQYSISIIDDHSRFIVGCEILDRPVKAKDVIVLLKKAIETYGPPREILTDHGAQFYANKNEGVSYFALWCHENGIKHILAGIRKPTTIGKVERWHRTLKEEYLLRLDDIRNAKNGLAEFIEYYNFKRIHFHYRREEKDGYQRRIKFHYIPAERYRKILRKCKA